MEGQAIFKALIFVLLLSFAGFPKTIEVCPACPVKSIKRAIELSEDGDTVVVRGGVYREGTLIVNKSIKLLGEGNPVIDGEGRYEVIRITADNVVVKGLTIVNSGRSEVEDIAGIKVEGAKNCVIEGNKLKNNFWAIYLANARNCRVVNNWIKGPFIVGEVASGNGIHIWHAKSILVKGNYITGHRDGIYFEFVEDSLIEGNTSEGNWRYGLHFMFSHRDRYVNNTFRRNGAGVAVMYTKKVVMEGNRFEENWGGSSYGLLLKAIDDSVVRHNVFFKNTTGILMDECQRTRIEENDFVENGWALRIWANSWNNVIRRNNFLGNTFDVATNSRMNPNRIEENYWSYYRGYDLNRDGVGDIPYRPVKLFSYMVENNPSSAVLLESFFVEVLNVVEETMPVVISVSVEDERPLMRRVDWRR